MPSSVNLIKNGSFSDGDKYFSSDYTYESPDPNFHTMPDEYSVVTNPGSQFNNGYNYFGDHTSDSGGMLFVDGTSSGAFWRQSVTLAANTTYSFTYYVTAADSESPGEIALSLNGSVVDAGFQITGVGGGARWQQVTASFTSGDAGSYALALSDDSNVSEGNDFAVDDIALRQTLVPPGGRNLLINGNFESETQGFSTDYTYEQPDDSIFTGVGEYSIVTNPATAFTNPYSSYGDHTTGSGKMLFVDGTNAGDFWRESRSLAANTTYSFTYFITGADATNLSHIAFTVNGSTVGAGFAISAQGGGTGWQEVTDSFTTSSKGAYTVALSDLDGVAEGNDFTVDDLSLVMSKPGAPDTTPPVVTAPTSVMVVAASTSGGAAIFSASAQDLVDGPTDPVTFAEQLTGGATQSAASGEVFSLGAHTIVATATDSAGNTGSATFDIEVTSGGATRAVISSGSYQEVYGVATDTTVESGGVQVVFSAGLASGTTVSGGGVLTVALSGLTDTTRVLAGGLVSGSGKASGVLTVQSGGTVSGISFGEGATDVFYAGASEAGVTISSGATLKLVDTAIANTLAVGTVASAETVSGAGLISGAILQTLDANVQAGGNLQVTAGGFATATSVSSGGSEVLSAGAVALGATVLSGGALVGPGALRDTLTVFLGGTATNVYVSAAATVIDNGLLLYSGAAVETLAGTLSGSGAILEDGAGRLMVSGATAAFTGEATLSGGVIDLTNAQGLAGGQVAFEQSTGATTLDIEAANRPANGATYATGLVDFDGSSKRLDLAGLTVSSGAKITLNGSTLEVVDGGYTAAFTLSGMVADSYVIVSNGAGGALVRAAAGAGTHSLVQAAAGFGLEAPSPGLLPLSALHFTGETLVAASRFHGGRPVLS